MPRLRKPQPVMLSDDQLYILFRLSLKLPKGQKWYPNVYERDLIQDAHRVLRYEFHARAKEDERIDAELSLIAADYEGIE